VIHNTPTCCPNGFYLRALYYNRKMFAEAGRDAPPRTLDEFLRIEEGVRTAGKYATACAAEPAASMAG